jgi:glycosyltransferase involved in cell wall biosynthesis
MMKLLYIVNQFVRECATGTEALTFRLAKAAQRSGHAVTVLTCSTDSDSHWRGTTPEGLRWASASGVPVYALPAALVSDPYGFAPGIDVTAKDIFCRFVANGGFDLAHVIHSLRMLDAVEIVRGLGIPYIVTLTDFFAVCYRINYIRASGTPCGGSSGGGACQVLCKVADVNIVKRQRRLRAVLASATERIACSQFVKNRFEQECPDLTFRVIPHGIDLLRFTGVEVNRDVTKIVFGYCGTMSEAKGIDILVNAFLEADVVDGKLVIVGVVHGNHDVESRVKSASKNDGRITFKGPVSVQEVPGALSDFDILCLPSQVPETFSLALHEAFAIGLPAIVSDLGHIAEVVRANACGLVAPATSIPAWSAAIKNVAANRGQLRLWQTKVPCPLRIEEEAFFYDQLYRSSAEPH